ncbi:hypothetical protein HWD35_05780 [Tsukamurella tyrosinosolvens]|uniref:hypothetical protein n=1 Tax=Tsukamurella tyrosinosolvens TaxID=57704 RepID=UPI001CE15805|nr:hypothetical protein [Tsukamurella tyrosinosolvens]MCA4994216.1 hypothetical protein [Tsukamurella tyrosinosolvens]
MDASQLVEHVNTKGARGIGDRIVVSAPPAYRDTWWRDLGGDVGVNARLVADWWASALPQSFVFLREIIRDRTLVAPVTILAGEREDQALLYFICYPDDDAVKDVRGAACVGFRPADEARMESARFAAGLPGDLEAFYRRVHDGFQIAVQNDGDFIVPVGDIQTWSERTGFFEPEVLEVEDFESIIEFNPYVPDPKRMVVVWEASSTAVPVDLDRPDECWQYTGGELDYWPRTTKDGFVNTPSAVVESTLLSYLGYSTPAGF